MVSMVMLGMLYTCMGGRGRCREKFSEKYHDCSLCGPSKSVAKYSYVTDVNTLRINSDLILMMHTKNRWLE